MNRVGFRSFGLSPSAVWRIRQRAAWDDEGDTFVYITPENVTAFLEGATKAASE
jgi:hypothetical protein